MSGRQTNAVDMHATEKRPAAEEDHESMTWIIE
jgi:hypothetical protein